MSARFRHFTTEEVHKRAYDKIPNNDTSPLNPYLILVRSAGIQSEYVKLYVYRNHEPWRKAQSIRVANKSYIVWSMSAYFGITDRSSFKYRLGAAIEARDFFNMLHRIERRQQRVSPEMIQAITQPHLRQKLIEAICIAAI